MKKTLDGTIGQRTLSITALVFGLAAVIAGGAGSMQAASPSEMLEKGIYAEETKGDIDGAIKIYEQVVSEGKSARAFAAQAQFRIGLCYQKKQQAALAREAFIKLAEAFPEQKDLLAKARQYLPSDPTLGPAPWVDGEVLQLTVKFASGFKIGTMVFTAEQAELDGRKVWRIGSRTFAGPQAMSIVHADWDTFQPLASRWKHSLLGDVEAVYRSGQVEARFRGKDEVKKADLEGVVYDNEQVVQLMRRLPLAIGYKTTIPCLTTLGGCVVVRVEAEVTGRETLTTEAGKFDCFRVDINLKQSFWFSADAHRYLVKLEAGGTVIELARIRQRRAGQSELFSDAKTGYALTAPAGWFYFEHELEAKDPLMVVSLIDPEAVATGSLQVVDAANLSADEKRSVRVWAEKSLAQDAKPFKDFKIRPDGWQERVVAGKPAVAVTADFADGQTPRVFYGVYVLAEPRAAKLLTQAPREQFEQHRQQWDAIVASCQIQ